MVKREGRGGKAEGTHRLGHAGPAGLGLGPLEAAVAVLLHEVAKDLALGHEVVQPLLPLGADVDALHRRPELLHVRQALLLRFPRLLERRVALRRGLLRRRRDDRPAAAPRPHGARVHQSRRRRGRTTGPGRAVVLLLLLLLDGLVGLHVHPVQLHVALLVRHASSLDAPNRERRATVKGRTTATTLLDNSS